MTKRLHKSALITLIMLLLCALSMLCAFGFTNVNPASADGTVSAWDGDLVAAGWGNDTRSDAELAAYENKIGYKEDGEKKKISLGSAAALAYFARKTNDDNGVTDKADEHYYDCRFSGYTVDLNCDVDLQNHLWIPIAFGTRQSNANNERYIFAGKFNGNGHKIYNFSTSEFIGAITYDPEKEGDELRLRTSAVDIGITDRIKSGEEYNYGFIGVAFNLAIRDLDFVNVHFDLPSKKFDGYGKTLLNDCVGVVAAHTVGDLTVENVNVGTKEGNDKLENVEAAGALIGKHFGGISVTDGVELPYGRLSFSSSKHGDRMGKFLMRNCNNYADITEERAYASKGGLVSMIQTAQEAIFEHCNNYGSVKGATSAGIVSEIRNQGNFFGYKKADYASGKDGYDYLDKLNFVFRFIDCNNYGEIRSNGYSDMGTAGIVSGVFLNSDNGKGNYSVDITFDGCNNYGDIYSSARYAAGIACEIGGANACGNFYVTAVNLFNYGDITNDYNSSRTNIMNVTTAIFSSMGANAQIYNDAKYDSYRETYHKHYPSLVVMNKVGNAGTIKSAGATKGDDTVVVTNRLTATPGETVSVVDENNVTIASGGVPVSGYDRSILLPAFNNSFFYGGGVKCEYRSGVQAGSLGLKALDAYFGVNAAEGARDKQFASWTSQSDKETWEHNTYQDAYDAIDNFYETKCAEKKDPVAVEKKDLIIENGVLKGIKEEFLQTRKFEMKLNGINNAYDIAGGTPTNISRITYYHPFTVEIPKEVTAIDKAAFMNMRGLTAVTIENGSALTEIGDFAFAGTRIKTIDLPATVETIGVAAFAALDKNFRSVTLPENIESIGKCAFADNKIEQVNFGGVVDNIGQNVFDSTALLIVETRDEYDALKDMPEMSGNLTYPVTIEYYDLSVSSTVPAGSEIKLFNCNYTMTYNADTEKWKNNTAITYVGLPTLGADNTAWYADNTCAGVSLEVTNLTQMLGNDGVTTIKLYTRAIGAGDEFVARTDIVYDGTGYPLGAINALLAARSKKVTDETVEIESFIKPNATAPGEVVPTTFLNAGKYVVKIGESEVTIVIARAKIYLANASTLEWRVNGNLTLLDRDGHIDSVVRSRGSVQLTLGLYNAAAKGYAVSNPANATQTGAGEYRSTFTLTADDNHEFVSGTVINAEARGLEVTLNADGTVTVVKTWYVVDMDNYFVGSDNNDYTVADRVYGSTATVAAPRLVHGTASDITLELYKDGTRIGQTFTVAEFNKYFNALMPAGEYTLRMNAGAVDYDEYDENGDPIESSKRTLHCAAFGQSVAFTVTPAALNAAQVEAINSALNGKTFKFIVGSANTSAENASAVNAVNAALEQLRLAQPSVTVEGNVWSTGTATITVNLAAAMSNVYGDFTKPITAGVYNYYYRLALANYAAVESVDGKLLSFTVAAYEYVDLPSVADLAKVYTGEKLTADVTGTTTYTVVKNDGGVNVGEYDVVFELVHPEYTLWKGSTLADNTSTHTVKFVITKASNDWIEAPDVVRWVEGEYNEEENTFIGATKFGTITYIITDTEDNVLYDAAQGINELAGAKAGTYILKATIVGTDNYNGLTDAFTIRILEKIGLPWWGTLCITLGALLIAAIIILILWKKGVFQILTGKIVLAIRTRASVDATIASVRAAKRMEEGKKSVAEAKRRESMEEARRKAEAMRALPPEERAAIIEAKAQAQAEKAEKMRLQSEAMKERAKKVRGSDAGQQPTEPEQEAAAAVDDDTETPTEE